MRSIFLSASFMLIACSSTSTPNVTSSPGGSGDTAPADATKGLARVGSWQLPPSAFINVPAAPSSSGGAPAPAPSPAQVAHTHCGWIGAGDTVGEASFVANAAQFDYVHPKWFTINSDGVNVHAVGNTDLASVVQAAKTNHVKLMPLVDSDSVNDLRTMLSSPANISAHVANLVALVKTHGYAGLDMDYEHLWTSADRAPFISFVQQLAAGLHAAGAELSLAIPGLGYDNGQSAYDYAAMASAVDVLHVMGYDFHYLGGDHLGPLAPSAWIDAVFARAATTGHADKFILGVANYAIGNGWWTTAHDAASRCTSTPATTTDEYMTCSYDHYADGRVQHCSTAQGDLWFEDVASMEEKLGIARSHGGRGITYWTIGDELPGYFAMAKKYFP